MSISGIDVCGDEGCAVQSVVGEPVRDGAM
jgi:hypothetical protein